MPLPIDSTGIRLIAKRGRGPGRGRRDTDGAICRGRGRQIQGDHRPQAMRTPLAYPAKRSRRGCRGAQPHNRLATPVSTRAADLAQVATGVMLPAPLTSVHHRFAWACQCQSRPFDRDDKHRAPIRREFRATSRLLIIVPTFVSRMATTARGERLKGEDAQGCPWQQAAPSRPAREHATLWGLARPGCIRARGRKSYADREHESSGQWTLPRQGSGLCGSARAEFALRGDHLPKAYMLSACGCWCCHVATGLPG